MTASIHTTPHHRLPQHIGLPALPASGAARRPRPMRRPKPGTAPRQPDPCPLSPAELRAIVLETMG